MTQMFTDTISYRLKEEAGAAVIEYAFLVVLITIAFITGGTALGTAINNFFQGLADFLHL